MTGILVIPIACTIIVTSVRPYKWQVYVPTSDKCTSLQVTSVRPYTSDSVCPYKWQCTSLQSQIANTILVDLHHWVSWQWKLTHYRMWLLVRASDIRTSACTGIYSDMKWIHILKCNYSLNLFMIPWQPLAISINKKTQFAYTIKATTDIYIYIYMQVFISRC